MITDTHSHHKAHANMLTIHIKKLDSHLIVSEPSASLSQ